MVVLEEGVIVPSVLESSVASILEGIKEELLVLATPIVPLPKGVVVAPAMLDILVVPSFGALDVLLFVLEMSVVIPSSVLVVDGSMFELGDEVEFAPGRIVVL
jgi:hypothetical protein